MISKFGKFCRNLRFERGELLYDMANKLGVSSSFLSRVETGQKKPPTEWREKIVSIYNLEGDELEEFEKAFFYSENEESLNVRNMQKQDRELLLEFARKFETLDKLKLRRLIDEKNE